MPQKTIRQLLKKIIKIVKTEGIGILLKKIFRRLVYRRQSFVILKLDLNAPQKSYKSSTRWTIRDLSPEDLDKTEKYLKKQQKNYGELLALECKAFGAFATDGGHLVFIVCYAERDFYDIHYQKHLYKIAPHQVYQFAGEIAAPYKTTLVHIDVLLKAWEYWRSIGKTEVFCSVNENNTVAIRFHLLLNFKEVGSTVNCYRLFGIKWSVRGYYSSDKFTQDTRKAFLN